MRFLITPQKRWTVTATGWVIMRILMMMAMDLLTSKRQPQELIHLAQVPALAVLAGILMVMEKRRL